jgi:hypothetical protein
MRATFPVKLPCPYCDHQNDFHVDRELYSDGITHCDNCARAFAYRAETRVIIETSELSFERR